MSLRSIVTAAALACLLTVNASPLAAQGAPGTITLAGEKVSFAPAVGLWDPETNRVSVAYFVKAPSTVVVTAARTAGAWDARTTAGPALFVEFEFTPGNRTAFAAQLKGCRIRAAGFRASLDLKGGAEACHILSIGGLLVPGSSVIGVLVGQGTNYQLSLPFSIVLVEPPAGAGTTSMASAAPAATAAPAPARAPAAGPSPASTVPPNTVAAVGTFNGQRVTPNQGLAWFDAADNEVEVALFDHKPAPGMLAELKTGSWGDGGPILQMTLRFTKGAAATIAAVTYCYVNVTFPKGGPIGTNTTAKGCGITELSGEARAGGSLAVKMKGQGPGPGDKPFTWDVQLNLPVAR